MDTSKYVKNGFTGIENIGNTCFINSCIQIINHTYELNEFFDSDKYKTHLKTDIIDSYATVAWDDCEELCGVANEGQFHLINSYIICRS